MPYKDPQKRKEYHKKYIADWQQKKKEHRRAYLKKFYSIPENREKRKERLRRWKLKNKDRVLQNHREYNEKNREKISEQHKKRWVELRLDVLNHYSNNLPQCACCKETKIQFLTIDHINNDGYEHRKQLKSRSIVRWLRNNNYPKGFQILCYNCNCAKGFYGKCPHQK